MISNSSWIGALTHHSWFGPISGRLWSVGDIMCILKWIDIYYRQTFDISRTKSHNLDVSRLGLQLSLPNPLKPRVKSRMNVVGETLTGDAPTTSGDQQLYCLLQTTQLCLRWPWGSFRSCAKEGPIVGFKDPQGRGMGCALHPGHALQCPESCADQWSVQWGVWRCSWCASGFCPQRTALHSGAGDAFAWVPHWCAMGAS